MITYRMKDQDASKISNRVVSIDGLRALFAAVVVAYHYTAWMEIELPGFTNSALARGAIYAVCGFFAISGASMALAYRNRSPDSLIGVAAFLLKRFFRIAPLYYLVLAIHTAGRGMRCLSESECSLDPIPVAKNLTFLFGFGRAAENSLVVAGWSIGIEWIFYFLFPAIFFVALRIKGGLIVLLALGAASLVLWDIRHLSEPDLQWVDYAQFPAYFFYFAVGIAIGVFVSDMPRISQRTAAIYLGLASAFYLVLEAISRHPFNEGVDVAGPVAWLFALATCAIVAATAQISVRSGVWHQGLKKLGEWSFGVYLLHFPVAIGVEILGLSGWPAFAAGVVLTIILAMLVYRFVEAPFVRLGNRLVAQLTAGRRPAPAD